MIKLILVLFFLITNGCNKPKSVLICGDHECINKAEARQFFEDNLTLEVRIVNKKKINEFDLVQLNLKPKSEKNISIFRKNNTNSEIKILSDQEISQKKKELKKRKKKKNKAKLNNKKIKKKRKVQKSNTIDVKIDSSTNQKISNNIKTVNKPTQEIMDICTILKDCSIDEISKYLINKGKKDNFPDITTRE